MHFSGVSNTSIVKERRWVLLPTGDASIVVVHRGRNISAHLLPLCLSSSSSSSPTLRASLPPIKNYHHHHHHWKIIEGTRVKSPWWVNSPVVTSKIILWFSIFYFSIFSFIKILKMTSTNLSSSFGFNNMTISMPLPFRIVLSFKFQEFLTNWINKQRM